MKFTIKEKEAIKNLLIKIEFIEKLLVKKGFENSFKNITKTINILKNEDKKGMKNIKHYLYMDSRQMFEACITDEELDKNLNDAFKIVLSNPIFNN